MGVVQGQVERDTDYAFQTQYTFDYKHEALSLAFARVGRIDPERSLVAP